MALASPEAFLYGTRPLSQPEKTHMLEESLSQLEQLVTNLVQQNQALQSVNAQLQAELLQSKDDNETLQLSLLEQEELQGETAARIQALLERAVVSSNAASSPANA